MPSTLDLRRRIRSVKNTGKITKAMQMVAAAKMRKAQAAAVAGRPYDEVLRRVLALMRPNVDAGSHELLREREVRKELIVIFSTDKGLAGALNSNLFRELINVDAASSVYVAVGRKGLQFLTRTRRDLIADFPVSDNPEFREIRTIGRFCMEKFTSGEVDRVRVLYSQFVNTLMQKPMLRTLLPIPAEDLPEENPLKGSAEYLFEPNEHAVLNAILPHYVNYELFQMVHDARASEHSARMVAMKSATDNAKQLVKDLTLDLNKARQASITTELLEITTAQLAVQ